MSWTSSVKPASKWAIASTEFVIHFTGDTAIFLEIQETADRKMHFRN
jgi:roadblock/LC7 domain-containing protein